jgi:L-alanine-DL-glutamate epimerase-like enolase superfamily enzyme
MEEGNKETADYKDLFAGGWNQKLSAWEVPEAPGLGVDIPEAFLRERQVRL